MNRHTTDVLLLAHLQTLAPEVPIFIAAGAVDHISVGGVMLRYDTIAARYADVPTGLEPEDYSDARDLADMATLEDLDKAGVVL